MRRGTFAPQDAPHARSLPYHEQVPLAEVVLRERGDVNLRRNAGHTRVPTEHSDAHYAH